MPGFESRRDDFTSVHDKLRDNVLGGVAEDDQQGQLDKLLSRCAEMRRLWNTEPEATDVKEGL
ncbi:MAG: hypothetical protein H5T69_01965 [Chloroflexi bacterium]|nr:hypothetical protein [Chloroflexota bacterium]